MSSPRDTLLLGAEDVAALLDYPACIDAVEAAFRTRGEGRMPRAAICGVHVDGGGFHVKAAALPSAPPYFASKTNANFPANPAAHGLPTIQGLLLLFDAERGVPLAIMDSAEITLRRTAAATAVAAKHLARPESRVLTIIGCGAQGRASVAALSAVLPLERVYALDSDPRAASSFAADTAAAYGVQVLPVQRLGDDTRASDVFVTCTPSLEFVLGPEDVGEGAFVAGVGADNGIKRELSPALLATGRLIPDVLEQAAEIGDLHHALESGELELGAVAADLGQVVAGTKPGRTSPEEITIFDSTGTAIQDVASAALVYERAITAGRGASFRFFGGSRVPALVSPRFVPKL
ncbi:MAG: ornithine cyclodeaminase family protein [Gemmatimonadota bacterium]